MRAARYQRCRNRAAAKRSRCHFGDLQDHIAYATLTKLAGRPALAGHHEAYWIVVIERFSAYGLLGFLLAFLLPGRVVIPCVLVAGVAVLLEILQIFIPSRDPAFFDVVQKSAGGITGVLLAQTILAFLPRPPSGR